MMKYLLDANVLIDANRDYYPINRVPEFWEWLVDLGGKGVVKIPIEVYEEIKEGNDELAKWAKRESVREALLFDGEVNTVLVRHAIETGYGNDLTDADIEKLGRDPFIIAYALAAPSEWIIVTTEASRPSAIGANRHLPDVCDYLGLLHKNTFEFVRELDFRTNWHS